MRHAREQIREITDRSRLLLPVERIVEDLNGFLGGWSAYFRYGNSAARFDKISDYARVRMERFISKRHRRSLAFGRWVMAFASPNALGLVSLSGNRRRPQALPGLAGEAECRR
jgi:RNA-directed DNA polymerase